MRDIEEAIDKLEAAIQALSSDMQSVLIFQDEDAVEALARDHFNMVSRDEVADIAVQELYMTPPREEDP